MADTDITKPGYLVTHMDHLEPIDCPCGLSRRAFVQPDNPTATFHVVDISADARVHYHKKLTEIYYVLETEADAFLELDGERIRVWPGSAAMIRPGTRHRAVGRMKIVNVSIPAFDPEDEWFD
jgi:mannose-6-phosphate isomerase-like protein (cupin superfamily)